MDMHQLLESLKSRDVAITRNAEVASYLDRNPQVIPILLGCVDDLRIALPNCALELTMFDDHEIDDHYPVLYVRLDEYPEGIADTIRTIRTRYYTSVPLKDAWILVTTDYAPKNHLAGLRTSRRKVRTSSRG